MANPLLTWAAENTRLQQHVTHNAIGRRVANRFVAGERLDEALAAATELNADGIGAILDLLGEGVTDLDGAAQAVAQYEEAVAAIAERGVDAAISIKLSQLGQTVDRATCVQNLNKILDTAEAAGVGVEVDMEDSSLISDTLALYRDAVAGHPSTRLAMQAALRRTPFDLEALASLKPRVRLVKGAYAEPVEVAEQSKADIRAQYKFLSEWLLRNGGTPAFGTHDDDLIAHVRRAAADAGRAPDEYEFQFLYGIRRDLQKQLVDEGCRVRVYIPYGSAWYPYLTRRMAERPANLLFFLRALIGR